MLNFTWNATHFDGRELKIKVNFTNAPEISPYEVQDKMLVEFKDRSIFYSPDSRNTLHESSATILGPVPK